MFFKFIFYGILTVTDISIIIPNALKIWNNVFILGILLSIINLFTYAYFFVYRTKAIGPLISNYEDEKGETLVGEKKMNEIK